MWPTSSTPQTEAERAAARAWFSPSGLYVAGEDNLRLRSLNSLTGVRLTCSGRIRGSDGVIRPFSFDHVANTNRTIGSTIAAVGEGWIVNLRVAVAAAAPLIGQTWAIVELVRGFTGASEVNGTLTSGYVTTNQPIAWPGSPMRGTLEGPGVMRSIAGTNPAANVEWSETVPTGARWQIISLTNVLVTDANVANRFPQLIIDDGAANVYQCDPAAAHAASITRIYNAGQGTARLDSVSNSPQWALPDDVTLLAGFRIRSATVNLQAGDNWGAPQLLVREWLEGA